MFKKVQTIINTPQTHLSEMKHKVSIFDVCKFFVLAQSGHFTHDKLPDYTKLEGYGMVDHVLDVAYYLELERLFEQIQTLTCTQFLPI